LAHEKEFFWSERKHRFRVASALEFFTGRTRAFLSDSSWKSFLKQLPNLNALRKSASQPDWFFQGENSSQMMEPGNVAQRLQWRLSLDLEDPLQSQALFSTLLPESDFLFEEPQNVPAQRKALRFVKNGQRRLLVLAREKDLSDLSSVPELVPSLLSFSKAHVAWLGLQEQLLEPASFLSQMLHHSQGRAGGWNWPKQGDGFFMVSADNAEGVFLEWKMATARKDFTQLFLSNGKMFFPKNRPEKVWVAPSEKGALP
jgi:hypothetical protein